MECEKWGLDVDLKLCGAAGRGADMDRARRPRRQRGGFHCAVRGHGEPPPARAADARDDDARAVGRRCHTSRRLPRMEACHLDGRAAARARLCGSGLAAIRLSGDRGRSSQRVHHRRQRAEDPSARRYRTRILLLSEDPDALQRCAGELADCRIARRLSVRRPRRGQGLRRGLRRRPGVDGAPRRGVCRDRPPVARQPGAGEHAHDGADAVTFIPFPEYRPDVNDYRGQHSQVVSGVLPQGDGYGPLKSLVPYSQGLPAACRGQFYARKSDGTIVVFAATATDLFQLNNTTLAWTPVSKGNVPYAALPSTDNWQFAQFGNIVVAVQANTVPQAFDISASTNFADLGGAPPAARYVTVVGQ